MPNQSQIRFDADNLAARVAGAHGLDAAEIDNLSHRIRGFRSRLLMERKQGEHGYIARSISDQSIEQTLRVAQPRLGRYRSVLLLGIGGSALGLRALWTALRTPAGPDLFVIDNSDPAPLHQALSSLDLRETLVVVVSKSGGTLETVLALGIVVNRLKQANLDLREHLLAVTDPEKGPLRRFVDEHELESCPLPSDVGGRFSVLTPAALLPAALLHLDIGALVNGAARLASLAHECDQFTDWPARLGLSMADLCMKHGKRCLVFMPYASPLALVANWFVQLWDESLGKAQALDGAPVEAGQTAVPALGATDQHAQLQLFLDGPNDKVVLFARVERHEPDMPVPEFGWEGFDAGFVRGKTLGRIINAQQAGAAQALAERGRPNATLVLPRLNAETLGELLMGLELATTWAGYAFGVNPYDQPAVEMGKRISRRMLGG